MFVLIYLVTNNVYIRKMGKCSIIVYIIGILLFTVVCILGKGMLPDENMEGVQDISLANDTYMPSYLGYFFVALSIPRNNLLVFWVVFGIIYIFTFFSQSSYFNPLFLLFGFNFYNVTSSNHTKVFIISRKKDIRSAKDVSFHELKRINDFTFIDKEK